MTDDNVTWHADETPPERARDVLVWLASMVLLLLGFWLLGTAIDQGQGVLFVIGVLSFSVAFALPIVTKP
jgi:membrane-bound ClpP family serine protease